MGSNRVLLSKNFKGYSKTIFVRNNIIYSKYRSNTFYKYDILSCDSTQISDEEYYFMRDESKYSVSISTLDVKIINNETNDNINISKDNMSREDSFSSIYNFNCFVIDDYRLHNDDIFLKLHYLYYVIIIRYDIINNHFELCDWLNCHYYSTDICFYVFENKYPASLERYFMVNAYE